MRRVVYSQDIARILEKKSLVDKLLLEKKRFELFFNTVREIIEKNKFKIPQSMKYDYLIKMLPICKKAKQEDHSF